MSDVDEALEAYETANPWVVEDVPSLTSRAIFEAGYAAGTDAREARDREVAAKAWDEGRAAEANGMDEMNPYVIYDYRIDEVTGAIILDDSDDTP